jgi:hypothetical protein
MLPQNEIENENLNQCTNWELMIVKVKKFNFATINTP